MRQLPDPSIFEQLDQVNVLLLPVEDAHHGGDQLADLISVIEPNYVVPMQPIRLSDADYALAVDGFLKLMGVSGLEEQDGLRVTPPACPSKRRLRSCVQPSPIQLSVFKPVGRYFAVY